MTITIKLRTTEPKTKYGYPLVLICSQGKKRPKKCFAHSLPEHFNTDLEMVTEAHPDYDLLAPKIMDFKLKARKIVLGGEKDPHRALKMVLGELSNSILLKDFAKQYIAELKAQALKYNGIGDYVNRNKALGNAKVYSDALVKIEKYFPETSIDDLDYAKLIKFREDCLTNGNTKSTVHLYLRSLRSLYNKCVKINRLDDKKPFAGVFDNLKVKSSSHKKKYVTIETVRQLEAVQHIAESAAKYVDLWLLEFYFGGCDLIDVYFLKNEQLRNGRVWFMRGKTTAETVIDLKIHPKAQLIIDKYRVAGEYVFPWRKDKEGYLTFRRKLSLYLAKVQKRNSIEVMPGGGILGIKVTRHTFGNIAKNLFIDPDLIRELMGHERDDVDQYYKDRFPQDVRDEALFRIIG